MVPFLQKIFDTLSVSFKHTTTQDYSPTLKGKFYGNVNINSVQNTQTPVDNVSRKLIHFASEAHDPGTPIVRDKVYQDVDIWGPALIAPMGNSTFNNCSFNGDVESLLWEVDPGSLLIGVIGVQNCSFINCNFKGIGIAGTPEILEDFRRALSSSSS